MGRPSTPHDHLARLTTRGRVTLPKPVRDALGLRIGDEVVFSVEGRRAVLAKRTTGAAAPQRCEAGAQLASRAGRSPARPLTS